MERQELEVVVRRIVSGVLSIDEESIKDDSSFVQDLSFDELDFVEMLMDLEDHFNIAIPDDEAEPVDTFRKMVDLVEEKIK